MGLLSKYRLSAHSTQWISENDKGQSLGSAARETQTYLLSDVGKQLLLLWPMLQAAQQRRRRQ